MVAALRLGTFNGDGSFVQFTASLFTPEDRRILLVALLLPGPSLEDRPGGVRQGLDVSSSSTTTGCGGTGTGFGTAASGCQCIWQWYRRFLIESAADVPVRRAGGFLVLAVLYYVGLLPSLVGIQAHLASMLHIDTER